MANLWYQLGGGGGTILNVYRDPIVKIQSDMQEMLADIQEIQGLSDDLRTDLIPVGVPSRGIPANLGTLEDFDEYVDEIADRLADELDYFDYESTTENINVREGDWFSPEAVESVSHEEVGSEATFAIDGENSTWWQSQTSGTRTIVFRLRSYKKKMRRIRLRVSNSGEGRTQLQNVTIKASNALGQIDNPSNVIDTGVNFTWGGSNWVEHVFTSPKSGRYIKLEVGSSLHSNADHVRIREIEVRVGIINHEKV